MTKDERFLVEVYRVLQAEGDLKGTVDPEIVATTLGIKERQLKTILRGLMQANFLKRYDEDSIFLTSNGLNLAKQLSS